MSDTLTEKQSAKETRFVLHPYRSLQPRGFLILMVAISLISFIVGIVFMLMGAWPVFGFFGLDVALIYYAFKSNYRSGRLYETIELSPELLKLTRVHPSGEREEFEFNPYWARVRVSVDHPDGRTSMRLAARGKEVLFGQFLTDDERRDFADALTGALVTTRGSRF
ncbi:DUF2244 domain-containing protein [Hyphomicrobium sp.]|jgi:uncharacterized membrane protein|uniref:DUF2244 domain-containing protein n=1 Tax=Hyphomicrobium sp. TaxID=82 RepID=UPI002B8B9B32|nr:DUF2244 domain-containing protein [Hyphomicrobium sp.]HVZ05564.1 DUF2244 domain-containing protein [Hyphomicrobium sp.]